MKIFNTIAYDPFINFVKGLSIICVVLTHNLPLIIKDCSIFNYWGGMAVPIFLLIQVFHTTRYFADGQHTLKDYFNVRKLFKRIILPFCFLLLCQIIIFFISGNLSIESIKGIIASGGIGPGSYYIWIYLQFWILTPFAVRIFNYMGGGISAELICVVISILLEIVCSLLDIPEFLYRLLFVRYFFLMFLGIYLYYGDDQISFKRYVLAFIGLAFLIVQSIFDYNLEPYLFYSGWNLCHFPTYYYVAFLLLPLIKTLSFRSNWIERVGKYSYEIFLLQMFVFTFFQPALNLFSQISGIDNRYVLTIFFIIGTTVLSIFPVIWYKRVKNKHINIIKD